MATIRPMSLQDPSALLENRFRDAIVAAFGSDYSDANPLIRATQNPAFGDFQANAAMGLAKRLGSSPRDVAIALIEKLSVGDLCHQPEIAGPGFINLTLRPEALASMLASMDTKDLGVEPLASGHRVVVDMVSVNIAKSMHVGHLRSAIIGDALCRILARLGYEPIPQNHLGDWGLQIAMVLADLQARDIDFETLTLGELEHAYRSATLDCKADRRALETAERLRAGPHRVIAWQEQVAGADEALLLAKATLVSLQAADPTLVSRWQRITALTLQACYATCALLKLVMTVEHERGESFYRTMLPDVIREFERSGLAEESDGALIVRVPDDETPLLIRKSDGGFLYATTDLAGIRYRVNELRAERIIYVVDARQRDHFAKVFAAARLIGWDRVPDASDQRVELVHLGFGSVCGSDGRPLKTRSGDNVKLQDLLEEAIRRAARIVTEKNPELPEDERADIARAIGIGCVKYADLSSQLNRDYVFDWDRMLAFEGNTGAYLLNQYVRIRSISRKAPGDVDRTASFTVGHSQEKALALVLLRYPSVLAAVGRNLEPNRLCQYLYDLSQAYSSFYTQCPVLRAETTRRRDGRLRLCGLTERVLGDGLGLLGISLLDRM